MREDIFDKHALVDFFASSCKPKAERAIGIECEQFIFSMRTRKRLIYQGLPGIQWLLDEISKLDWAPLWEVGKIVGLNRNKANISLEPGGQLEFASTPHATLDELYDELDAFEALLAPILKAMDCFGLKCGADPITKPSYRGFIPKQRYTIMKDRMQQTGQYGLDMMTNTCTVQASLDYESEQDMANKFWIAMALQPLTTALFATSCFFIGHKMPYTSTRGYIWSETDSQRCGILPFAFGGKMTFDQYASYVADVPMYFIMRNQRYLAVPPQPFSDFLQGKLIGFEKERPCREDWQLHLTTVFPEVRLKNVIEVRGADSGPYVKALPTFWVGALYDEESMDKIKEIIEDWSFEDVRDLSEQVYKTGLNTPFKGKQLYEWAEKILEIITSSLVKMSHTAMLSSSAALEALKPLISMISHRKTVSDLARERWHSIGPGELPEFAEFMRNPENSHQTPNPARMSFSS